MMRFIPFLAIIMIATGVTVRPFTAEAFSLWDVAAKEEISLAWASSRFSKAKIVFIGEQHDQIRHHQAQLEVIRAIHGTGKAVAVGLEMFQKRDQRVLDQWISGDMDEEAFKVHFQSNWGYTWPLYRDIFLHCREKKIPMIGLNVPRDVTVQVAREGFASLTEEQAGMLPFVTCQVDPEYEAFIREAYGYHTSGSAFTHFCEAQLVWDTGMAIYALEYLQENTDYTLVALVGFGHAWKKGIPVQIRKQRDDIHQVVILPEVPDKFDKHSVKIDDCDYMLLGL